jgi:hypothetical protein
MTPEPPPEILTGGDNTLIGCLFAVVLATLGLWSMWQRRHAWGWWESPTSIGVILLTAGAVCVTPMFFGRQHIGWWSHSYIAADFFTFAGLAFFAITMKRRQQHGAPPIRSIRLIVIPTIVGLGVIVAAYIGSGAWQNPWLLDPAVTGLNTGIRILWTTIACVLTYLLAIIAHQLVKLLADKRRGDRGPVIIYLGSCLAGMGLSVIAIAAAQGYGATPSLIVSSALLFGIMTSGKIGISGLSWRRKRHRMSEPSRSLQRID